MAKRWTRDEDRALLEGTGSFGLSWFAKRVGTSYEFPGAPKRSPEALYARARTLWGKGGLTRGSYSESHLARESGYSRSQLRRARKALRHSYRRLSPKGQFLISDDQRVDIYDWLSRDFWSKSLHRYNCAWCHSATRPHKGAGLCIICYYRLRRLTARLGVPSSIPALLVLAAPRKTPAAREAHRRLRIGVMPKRDVLEALAQEKDA